MTGFEEGKRAFEQAREEIEKLYPGKSVLFADGKMQSAYNDFHDAYIAGMHYHGKGQFYIKEVGEPPIQLGFIGTLLQGK